MNFRNPAFQESHMKLALLAAILTALISVSGPDDPARKARDIGDVKTPQTEITNAAQKAKQTKLFEDYIRVALLAVKTA
jgi:hypothetical protein